MARGTLLSFVRESNRIEGILRRPRQAEVTAHRKLLGEPWLGVEDLVEFVRVAQPDARLRSAIGLDVQVGSHVAPPGGWEIRARLEEILGYASRVVVEEDVYKVHQRYEHLHPFTDCNGRSGRALWLWTMRRLGKAAPLGFLHHFYYQALQEFTERR